MSNLYYILEKISDTKEKESAITRYTSYDAWKNACDKLTGEKCNITSSWSHKVSDEAKVVTAESSKKIVGQWSKQHKFGVVLKNIKGELNYTWGNQQNEEEDIMSKFQKYLTEMATDIERETAMKTARSAGAVGAKAVVPRAVREYADKENDVILDFGSGPKASHTVALRNDGYNVTAYDFSEGEYHDANALKRKYTLAFASNVLNVQGSEEMLMHDTLFPIYKALVPGGKFIANLPSSPLKGLFDGISYREGVTLVENKLKELYKTVNRIKGYSTPMWICVK